MASKPWVPPTPDHERMIGRLAKSYKRISALKAKLDDAEEERAALYLEAREMDPPVTYAAIADVFEVTEAAVMQRVNRALAERAERLGAAAGVGRPA